MVHTMSLILDHAPRPQMNVDSPMVATSWEALNSGISWAYVVVYIDDVQVLFQSVSSTTNSQRTFTYTQTEPKETIITINHRRAVLILRGFIGSFSSQPTR